jgi:hypothetical protein
MPASSATGTKRNSRHSSTATLTRIEPNLIRVGADVEIKVGAPSFASSAKGGNSGRLRPWILTHPEDNPCRDSRPRLSSGPGPSGRSRTQDAHVGTDAFVRPSGLASSGRSAAPKCGLPHVSRSLRDMGFHGTPRQGFRAAAGRGYPILVAFFATRVRILTSSQAHGLRPETNSPATRKKENTHPEPSNPSPERDGIQ